LLEGCFLVHGQPFDTQPGNTGILYLQDITVDTAIWRLIPLMNEVASDTTGRITEAVQITFLIQKIMSYKDL